MPEVRVITIHATRSMVAADSSSTEDGLTAAYCGQPSAAGIHVKEIPKRSKIGKLVDAVLLNIQNFAYGIV